MRAMAYYRLCFMKGGRAGCFDEFSAADDQAALREAELHMPAGYAELWCGERQVATVRGRQAASVPAQLGLSLGRTAWLRPEAG